MNPKTVLFFQSSFSAVCRRSAVGVQRFDNAAIGRAAAAELLRLNLASMAFLPLHRTAYWSKERTVAFARAVRERGFKAVDLGDAGESVNVVSDRLVAALRALPKPRGLRVEKTEKIGAAGVHRRQTVVRRGVEGGRTVTTISPVEGDARVQEIARMLGGAGITTVALDHAQQMLDRTAKRRK